MKKVRHIGEVFIIQVSHGEYDDYTSYEFDVPKGTYLKNPKFL